MGNAMKKNEQLSSVIPSASIGSKERPNAPLAYDQERSLPIRRLMTRTAAMHFARYAC
jgi:hypothetical protein